MTKYKVTMICREISRVEVIVKDKSGKWDLEAIKDIAWAKFDANRNQCCLEQENFTKVEVILDNS